MKLSKKMIEHIESLHKMDKDELYETYGEMIQDSDSGDATKLKSAYHIYATLHGKEPNKVQKDKIFRCFQNLIMQDDLKTYGNSESGQRLVKRLYKMHYEKLGLKWDY
jgi:hypothetical protein